MTTEGWIFLGISWALVAWGSVWSMRRVLTSKKHWNQPEQDIAELHHGEFGEPKPPSHPG